MVLINRLTEKEPTLAEMQAIRIRANEILRSAYSSLEQIEWAMSIPGVDVEIIWQASRETKSAA